VSSVDVPAFDRSAMDGYALYAEATEHATPEHPAVFNVVGDSLPGRAFDGAVGPRQAVRIMTGAPIPAGADVVVPVEVIAEDCPGPDRGIAVPSRFTAGKNIGCKAEDVRRGQLLFCAGRVLRPQDVGVLASIGASPVSVVRRPRVQLRQDGGQ